MKAWDRCRLELERCICSSHSTSIANPEILTSVTVCSLVPRAVEVGWELDHTFYPPQD
jgi:hypothetical protein